MSEGPTGTMVDVASKAIVTVGFPTFVAAVLLWFILRLFTSDLTKVAAHMDENARAIESFVRLQNDQLAEMKAHTQELREQTALMKDFVSRKKAE